MKSIYPWATVPHLAEEFAPKLQAQCVQTHYKIAYKSILPFFNFNEILLRKTREIAATV